MPGVSWGGGVRSKPAGEGSTGVRQASLCCFLWAASHYEQFTHRAQGLCDPSWSFCTGETEAERRFLE